MKKEIIFNFFKEKKLDSIILILLLFLILIGIYMQFFSIEKCNSFGCFKEKMESCSAVTYINDGEDATWKYQIGGKEIGNCKISVELLLAKEGELGIEKLIGHKMDCEYPLGVGTYPEKDLRACHGLLKEGLQQIIIDKLHSYIIENLGQIDKELNSL